MAAVQQDPATFPWCWAQKGVARGKVPCVIFEEDHIEHHRSIFKQWKLHQHQLFLKWIPVDPRGFVRISEVQSAGSSQRQALRGALAAGASLRIFRCHEGETRSTQGRPGRPGCQAHVPCIAILFYDFYWFLWFLLISIDFCWFLLISIDFYDLYILLWMFKSIQNHQSPSLEVQQDD